MNDLTIMFQKFLIIGFYIYQYFRFAQAKRYDVTMKFKFGLFAWIETIVLLAANATFMIFPVSDANRQILMAVGIGLMLFTYMHTYRMIAIGKKMIFVRQQLFELRQVTKKSYQGGKLTFVVRGVTVKVWVPVADMTVVMEKISGRRPR